MVCEGSGGAGLCPSLSHLLGCLLVCPLPLAYRSASPCERLALYYPTYAPPLQPCANLVPQLPAMLRLVPRLYTKRCCNSLRVCFVSSHIQNTPSPPQRSAVSHPLHALANSLERFWPRKQHCWRPQQWRVADLTSPFPGPLPSCCSCLGF